MERAATSGDVTGAAGATPLVRASRLAPGAECFLKLELRNPTGSWWDRVAARAVSASGASYRGGAAEAIAVLSAVRAKGVSVTVDVVGALSLEEKRTLALFGHDGNGQANVDPQATKLPWAAAVEDAAHELAGEIREALGRSPDVLVLPNADALGLAVAAALGCRALVAEGGTWADTLALARAEGVLAHPHAARAAIVAGSEPGLSVALIHETGERQLAAHSEWE